MSQEQGPYDMGQAGTDLANRLNELSLEQIRFAQDLVRIGVDAANRMLQARDIDDAVEVQRAYVKESLDRIFDEEKYMFHASIDTLQETQGAAEKTPRRN